MSTYLDACDLDILEGVDCLYNCLNSLFSLRNVVQRRVSLVFHPPWADGYSWEDDTIRPLPAPVDVAAR